MRQFICFTLAWLCLHPLWALDICSHRGIRGLKPENTLSAFKAGLNYPIDCIDMDVVLTKDNIPVVYHDLYLNPQTTRDAKGHWVSEKKIAIKDLSFKQLQGYNVGKTNPHTAYGRQLRQQIPEKIARIPSLDATLKFIVQYEKKPVQIQIEIKTDPRDKASADYKTITLAVAQKVHALNLERRTKIQAFDWRCLTVLKQYYPRIQRAYLTEANPTPGLDSGVWTDNHLLKDYASIPDMIHQLGGQYWDAEDTQLTAQNIKRAHDLGLKVCAWTDIEKPHHHHSRLIKTLKHNQIDCLITDKPWLNLK